MSPRHQLPLLGISRNKPDDITDDGTLQEMINMRPKEGAWRIVGEKQLVSIINVANRIMFIHHISPTRKGWWYTAYNGSEIYYRITNEANQVLYTGASFDTFSGTIDQVKFASLGNAVIMMDTNDEVMQAYLFEADQGTYGQYRLMGDLLPDLVKATITSADDGDGSTLQVVAGSSTYAINLNAELIKELAAQKEEGYWANRVYFRYAYELFDGSVVKHSQPIRIDGGVFDNSDGDTNQQWIYDSSTYFETHFNKKKAVFTITGSDLATIQSNYAGIIKGINIYMCRPSDQVEIDESKGPTYVGADSPIDIVHTNPELAAVEGFYLVKSLSLEELSTSPVNILEGEDITDITLKDTMPYDNNTHHTLYSADPFNYNQRIFFSKIKNTLFSGFNPDLSNMYPHTDAVDDILSVYCEVTIDTDQGEKKVVSGQSTTHTNYASMRGYLACFAYPDTRASKVRIVVRNTTAGTYKYSAEYALTMHKKFNFAYIEDAEFDDDTTTTLATENKQYWDYNRVQATELMNPFYFPTSNSYRVGNSAVVGLAVNVVAISTSQFGEYPIYAFATDGIWTMQMGGDGEVLIQSIKPLSRHVCNNVLSIQNIDGGCSFSTDKGLFIIAGAKPIEISKTAEGDHLGPLANNADLTGMLSNLSLDDYLCSDGFLDYLSGAIAGYDFEENEILVSNASYDYTWVYNVDNNMWYKITLTWHAFLSDFPGLFGMNYSIHELRDINTEDTTKYLPMYLETRPINFKYSGLKRIMRILIDGTLYDQAGMPSAVSSVMIFGSTDGISWAQMWEDSPDAIRRYLVGRLTYSCEYFILVIASEGMLADGYLDSIIVDVKSRFDRKLRFDQ